MAKSRLQMSGFPGAWDGRWRFGRSSLIRGSLAGRKGDAGGDPRAGGLPGKRGNSRLPFSVSGLFSGAPGDKLRESGGRSQVFFPGLSLDIHNPDNSLLPDQLRGSVPGGEEVCPTLGEVLLKPRFLQGQGPPPDTP